MSLMVALAFWALGFAFIVVPKFSFAFGGLFFVISSIILLVVGLPLEMTFPAQLGVFCGIIWNEVQKLPEKRSRAK